MKGRVDGGRLCALCLGGEACRGRVGLCAAASVLAARSSSSWRFVGGRAWPGMRRCSWACVPDCFKQADSRGPRPYYSE